ncbi:MAG: hypothetical protein ACFFCZ_27215 [Promethearchaeota archaeon]
MQNKSNITQKNFNKGLIYGLGATLVGALGWAIVAYILNYTFALGAIVIGYIVAYTISIGTGDINKNVLISTFLLTLFSVFLGDFIFILLILMLDYGAPFSIELITLIIENFIAIELEMGGLASFAFAIIGAVVAVVQLTRQKQAANSVKGFLVFTEKKPLIVWSPRFLVPVKLSPTNNTEEALLEKLTKFGFSLDIKRGDQLYLTRTNKRPEIRLIGSKEQIKMVIPLPKEQQAPQNSEFLLLYTKTPFFDTGDLWKAAKDLKGHLEA